jgi:hypothetical protein
VNGAVVRWASAGRERFPAAAVLAGVGIATCVAVIAGNGNPALAVVPVALATALYVMAKAPLRVSVSALVLLVLSLDRSGDAAGIWNTPVAIIGDLLSNTLQHVIRVPIPVSGLDLAAVYLLAVGALRGATRAEAEQQARSRAAGAISQFLWLYVLGLAFADLNGAVRGAGVGLYKLRQLLQIPLLFLLFDRALRTPRDLRLVGRVVVLAACIKSVLALAVQELVAPALTGGQLAHATNHGDSVLFSIAIFLVVVDFTERVHPHRWRRIGVILPLLVLGVIANDRRVAWVMLAVSLVTAYVLSPPRRWKRALTRGVLIGAPVLALYVAVGWERAGGIFVPVHTIRSLTDSSIDSSAFWRDVENWNIAVSLREQPILGIGLGREYTEHMKGDDISSIFADFRAWPHNSVLGLLLFAGPIAFTAIWSLFGFTAFLAIRAYRVAVRPDERAAALGCVATVIACAVLAFSDTGAYHPQYRIFSALALAIAGKVAVSSGAWPRRAVPDDA